MPDMRHTCYEWPELESAKHFMLQVGNWIGESLYQQQKTEAQSALQHVVALARTSDSQNQREQSTKENIIQRPKGKACRKRKYK